MKVIRTILKDRAALKERFLPDMQHGGIFIPKAVDLTVGETLCLWLQLRSLDAELHLYGIVYWLRHRADDRHQHLRSGAGVGFRAGQQDQVDFLRRAFSSRMPGFPLRRPTRTPLLNPWRCSIRANGGEPRQAVVTDISRDGAQCMVGALPVEVIKKVIAENRNQVRYCYEVELQRHQTLQGRVLVKFVIAANGSVAAVRIESSTLNSPVVERCILAKIKGWRFPPPVGGGLVEVRYPFVFKAS